MNKDVRHFILETVDFGKFDVVEYKEYQKLEKENKRLKDNFDFNLGAIENIRKQKDYFEDMCAIRTQALLDIKEYIETNPNIEILLKDSIKDFLDHDELIERKQYQHILDIVNKAIGDDKSE